jgi:3-phenylpropionate/cinnamic acid dioxygenase small subunit
MVSTNILTRQAAEEFVYAEARLLDERKFEAWMDLFAEDGHYWVPIIEDSDPTTEPSLFYDDKAIMWLRVQQLLHSRNVAQMPPSRTTHQLTNVETMAGGSEDEALVRCTMSVHEIREGDHLQLGLGDQRAFAGHCEYLLRHEEDWRIVLKKVVLISRHLPITNLSFLL